MECFFAPPGDISGPTITLRGDESRHLVRVLRKSLGDRVWVTDGQDRMYEMEVTAIGAAETSGRIVQTIERFNEPTMDVTLGVSLLRNPSRFDYVVEKATELGARRIVPLLCEHTIPDKGKVDRFRKLALAAMKQCCRSYLPVIDPPRTFVEFLTLGDSGSLRILPHEKAPEESTITHLVAQRPRTPQGYIAIGPEGGFSDAEVDSATKAEWELVRMGPRRLRAETAALVSLTLVLHR